MEFTVALLQLAPFGNDQSRNMAKGLQYCREVKARGADLALFPELWNIGFTPKENLRLSVALYRGSAAKPDSPRSPGEFSSRYRLDLSNSRVQRRHPVHPVRLGTVRRKTAGFDSFPAIGPTIRLEQRHFATMTAIWPTFAPLSMAWHSAVEPRSPSFPLSEPLRSRPDHGC